MSEHVLEQRSWTFDDVAELDGRFEVVDGQLLPVSAPTSLHDLVAHRIQRTLLPHAPDGWNVLSATGIRLGTDGRSPDVAVVREPLTVSRRQVGWFPEDTLLLVEVVSPSTRKNDRFFKPIEYAMAGVPHYWRVETEPEVFVVVHELRGDRYEETATLRGVHDLSEPFSVVLDVPSLAPEVVD